MNINVKIDENQIKNIQTVLGNLEKKTPQIVSRALNRSLTTMQATLKKEVRKKYQIKVADINVTLTKDKSNASNLQVKLSSKGNPIPLDKFKVSPKTVNPRRKNSLKVAVKKDSGKVLPGAFMADLNGAKLFKRTAKPRLPIERLFGPSVPQMVGMDENPKVIQEDGIEMYDKRIDHEISRILGRD